MRCRQSVIHHNRPFLCVDSHESNAFVYPQPWNLRTVPEETSSIPGPVGVTIQWQVPAAVLQWDCAMLMLRIIVVVHSVASSVHWLQTLQCWLGYLGKWTSWTMTDVLRASSNVDNFCWYDDNGSRVSFRNWGVQRQAFETVMSECKMSMSLP